MAMLDDPSVLNELIRYGREALSSGGGAASGGRSVFHDEYDMEVDRLLTSSPPIMLDVSTCELDSLFKSDVEEPERDQHSEEGESSHSQTDADKEDGSADAANSSSGKTEPTTPVVEEELFRKVDVIVHKSSATSNLTELLKAPNCGPRNDANCLKLTVYLPNYSSMLVSFDEESTFEEAIRTILETHKEEGIRPALKYHMPEIYEILMHEGDGEPDRDFVFKRTDKIKENNLEDICLCESQEASRNGGARSASSSSSKTGRESLAVGRDGAVGGESKEEKLKDNTVKITIPNSKNGFEIVSHDKTTTMRQLLPIIYERHRIRLFTEEFSFVLTNHEDQTRLKVTRLDSSVSFLPRLLLLLFLCLFLTSYFSLLNLSTNNCQLSSPIVDLDATVSSLQARHFTLRQRVFSDSTRVSRPNIKSTKQSEGNPYFAAYNDVSVKLLQEWRIVKTNRNGKKQQRVLGIDGSKIYNSKRLDKQRFAAPSQVAHPDRDIADVRSIDIIEDDVKSFKIKYKDTKGELEIEYTCETAAECTEIVQKVQYILNLQRQKEEQLQQQRRGTTMF